MSFSAYSLPRKERGKLVYDYKSAISNLIVDFKNFLNLPDGRVALVKRDILWISFKDVSAIKPNYEFVIYKPGKSFRDPETGMVFPGIDEPVGYAKIIEIKNNVAIARVIKKISEIKKGYRVGSPEEIKLYIEKPENRSDVSVDVGKLYDLIRFSFMEEPTFTVYSAEEKPSGYYYVIKPVLFKDTSGALRLSFVVNSSFSNVSLVALNTKVKLVRSISSTELMKAQEAEATGKWGQFAGLITTRVFKKKYKLVSAGDVNGDGQDELVLIADGLVDVYQIKGKEFVRILRYDMGRRGEMLYKFLWVDVADIDRDGTPEIYVSAVRQDLVNGLLKAYPESFVLIYDAKKHKLRRRKTFGYLIRVIKNYEYPEGVLLGQKMGEFEPFVGHPFMVRYEKGKYVIDKKAIPSFVKAIDVLYGWTYDDINKDGKAEVIVMDDTFLRIYSLKGEPIWESPDTMGKFTHVYFYLTPRFVNPPTMKNFDPLEVAKIVRIERRIETRYCEEDDKPCIFTIENDVPGFLIAGIHVETNYTGVNGRVVKIEEVSKGVVYGAYFDVLWETPKYRAIYGEDFALGDFNRDGVLDVAFLGFIKKAKKARVDIYKIPGM